MKMNVTIRRCELCRKIRIVKQSEDRYLCYKCRQEGKRFEEVNS